MSVANTSIMRTQINDPKNDNKMVPIGYPLYKDRSSNELLFEFIVRVELDVFVWDIDDYERRPLYQGS